MAHKEVAMDMNVGGHDRTLRAVAGPLLMGIGASRLGSATGKLLIGAGGILLGTALTRKCPINALFGIDTAHSAAAAQPTGAPDIEKSTGMPAAAQYAERSASLQAAPD
jgi:hypothetical protein